MTNLAHILQEVDALTEDEKLELLAHVALQLKTTKAPLSERLFDSQHQPGSLSATAPLFSNHLLSEEEHQRILALGDSILELSQPTGEPVSNRDHDLYLYGSTG